MKKCILFLSAALIAFSIQSCRKISGDGPTITETRSVPAFSSINDCLDAYVHYTPASVYSLDIHAQKNVIDNIETDVTGGELKIKFRPHFFLGHHDRIDVYISAPDVTGLDISGSGGIDVTQPFHPQNLELNISGSGSISITELQTNYLSAKISGSGDMVVNDGIVDREKLTISGSGNLDMLNVPARTAETHTSGSGTTRVNVSESLDVHVSGSGDVYYKGNPAITASISGSGKVKPW